MELIEINSENAEEFAAYINEDIREDLERTFFSGIGALSDDGSPKGAMVYELKNSESEHDTRSRIHLFKADDKETKKALMNEYDSAVENEGVAESFMNLRMKPWQRILSRLVFRLTSRSLWISWYP